MRRSFWRGLTDPAWFWSEWTQPAPLEPPGPGEWTCLPLRLPVNTELDSTCPQVSPPGSVLTHFVPDDISEHIHLCAVLVSNRCPPQQVSSSTGVLSGLEVSVRCLRCWQSRNQVCLLTSPTCSTCCHILSMLSWQWNVTGEKRNEGEFPLQGGGEQWGVLLHL